MDDDKYFNLEDDLELVDRHFHFTRVILHKSREEEFVTNRRSEIFFELDGGSRMRIQSDESLEEANFPHFQILIEMSPVEMRELAEILLTQADNYEKWMSD